MRTFCAYIIVAVIATHWVAVQQVSAFRQYIEAEDCKLTKLKTSRNPLGGYVGDRFAFNIFKQPDSGKLLAPLHAEIRPGAVKVFVRAYCGDGSPRSRVMTVRLGSAEASLEYPDKPFANKHNWLPFELTTKTPADHIEIEVRATQGGRVIVDSILISKDPDDRAYSEKGRTRLAQRDASPRTLTARRAGEGNMLINSGFEVAPTNGWRSGYQSQWALTEKLYDTTNRYEGERCLRCPLMRNKRAPLTHYWQTYDGIYSAPMQLEQGATYTASIYVRADGPISGVIGLKGAVKRFKLDDSAEWRRVSASVQAKADADAFYVSFQADAPRNVWLDAAQLEQGELTDYSPGRGIDVGVFCGRAGRVWREGDDVRLTWEAHGRNVGSPFTVRYQIHDALGRLVQRDSFTAQAPDGQTKRIPLRGGPHPTGAYRVAYTIEAPNAMPYSGQICYSVIPKARGGGDGPVGLYASHSRQCFAAMANAGIHWTNTLSSAGHFAEWTYVEPKKGSYVFHDDDIALAREFGVRICANINTNRSSMPKWALREAPGEGEWVKHPMGYFKLADWEQFVFALVEHYRDDVKHWLVLDEPDVGTNSYSPEDYAKMLRAAYRAAKRADPESVVLAHTGTSKGWHEKVLALAGPEFFDAQYTYIGRFNRQVGDRLLAEARRLKRPLWTVDFAPVRQLSTPYAAIVTDRIPSWDVTAANTRKYDIWAVRSLSWGRAEKWFRYDARYPGPPPGTSYMSIWEHDSSLTPHGVSIAAMNALIADAKPQGEVDMPEGMEGHLFIAGDRKLLIAWTTDGTVRSLGIKAAVWDVYGGGLEAPLVGPLPTFIEFRGKGVEWKAPVLDWIEAEMLQPESDDHPYRARFIVHARGPTSGEWVAEGPYFLRRDAAQRIPCEVSREGRAELTLPLNVWPSLPVRGRQVRVRLYLPGRMLTGTLSVESEPTDL